MSLRPYQTASLDEIRLYFRRGLRMILLWLATGAGKTVVFCEMVKGAVKNGRKCIIVVRGRKLVDQASQRLFREGVEHGVLMAGHWNFRPTLAVQVCSVDTLLARNLVPPADLVIIDEVHLAVSDGYRELLARYPDAYIVGVTATPYDVDLRHCAQAVIHPISMQGLIDEGYLVPFRYFAPSTPNLEGVAISKSTKDYVNDQLADRMIAGQITGSVIEHWKKLAEGRPTLCFAVNIKHSQLLVQRFNEAGIVAEHCDADTPDRERNEIIRRLEHGSTKVVCNVGIFCTGVDIPSIGCLIGARPTQSYNLFIQQAGRGTRPAPGKSDCIYLDHAGNLERHELPTMEPQVDLRGKIVADRAVKKSKICKNCFAVYRGEKCPECGVEAPPHAKEVVEGEGELAELQITAKSPIEQWLQYLKQTKGDRKIAWVYWQLVERYPFDECVPYLPAWFIQTYKERKQGDPFASSPFMGVARLE